MRILCSVGVAAAFFALSSTALAVDGTVRLKNGGWIEGDILEVLPNEVVRVRTADGTVREVPWAEVERVEEKPQPPAVVTEPAAVETPTEATPQASSEAPPEPPKPPTYSASDPNLISASVTIDGIRIWLLGVPPSHPSTAWIRLERFVKEPELAECKELSVRVGDQFRTFALRHRAVREGPAYRETLEAEVDVALVDAMASAERVELDACGTKRSITAVNHPPIARFAKQFHHNATRPPLAARQAPPSFPRDYERASDEAARPGESERSTRAVTFALLGMLGVAGKVSVDATATDGLQSETFSGENDLDTTFGFGAHVDAAVHRHFGFGALLRYIRWSGEGASDGASYVDVAACPRLRAPFAMTGGWGAVYIQVPIGIAAVLIDEQPEDVETSPAFVIGVGGGVQILFAETVGVVLEVGWLRHAFEMKSTASGIDATADMTTGQLAMQLGLVFAL